MQALNKPTVRTTDFKLEIYMYVLFILIISAQGSMSITTQDMTSSASCYAAKAAIEQQVHVVNQRTLVCVAK